MVNGRRWLGCEGDLRKNKEQDLAQFIRNLAADAQSHFAKEVTYPRLSNRRPVTMTRAVSRNSPADTVDSLITGDINIANECARMATMSHAMKKEDRSGEKEKLVCA